MPDPALHIVNTESKLFVNPMDMDVPSSDHPCVPTTGDALVAIRFMKDCSRPYPITDRSTVALYVTFDGQLVYLCQLPADMNLSGGLDGNAVFRLRRNEGSVISTGVAQMSVIIDGVMVLNDSVSLVDAPVRNPVGCGCATAPVMSNLGVVEQYVEPSEDMEGMYILYLGATGQLIRGCVYRCMSVDGTWTWVPKTDPADDNLRLIEWQL